MLLECQHCGAPLDVKPGAETNKCRYCGRQQQIKRLRTIAAETPLGWKPPQIWRPPPNVPAPSNVELKYHGGGGAAAGVIVLLTVLLPIGIVAAVLLTKTGGPFSGIAPEKLDRVTFKETPKELEDKLGGSFSGSAKWLRVDLKGNWDYAVFSYDEKDMTHPKSVSVHASKRTVCNAETNAIRKKLREDLGPRFDGTSWRWGTLSLYLDPKCAHFALSSDVTSGSEPDDEDKGDWKAASEAAWKLMRADVLGRTGGRPTEEEMQNFLAGGYDASEVGTAIGELTIDGAKKTIAKRFPGSTFSTSGGLTAEIPLAHTRLGTTKVRFENKKGGGVTSVDVQSFGNNLTEYVEYARCLSKKSGAFLEVKETDYAKKTQSASLKFDKMSANVSQYGLNSYSGGFGAIPAKPLRSLFDAIAKCTD